MGRATFSGVKTVSAIIRSERTAYGHKSSAGFDTEAKVTKQGPRRPALAYDTEEGIERVIIAVR